MLVNDAVRDVTEATWDTDVIQRSYQAPVVVDFWAPWCGPCRVLGPTLERLAGEAEGAWTLAKLNVDHAPNLSAQYGIQGIPAVKAFKNGKVVAQFVGAQPETGVRRFLSTLAPTQAELLLDKATALEAKGDWSGAADTYRQILAAAPDDAAATLGLGRALFRAGQETEAVSTLERIADHIEYGSQARALLGQARLTVEAREIGGEAVARARLAQNPNDLDAIYGLAASLATTGDYRGAFDNLLSIVRRNRHWRNDAARETMVELFDLLGDDDPLTREYRNKLAQALF